MAEVSAFEQWILEIINFARLDPTAAINSQGIYFINQGLPADTLSTAPKHVLAMSDVLIASADFHYQWMLETGIFDTTGYLGSNPGDRMAAFGFNDGDVLDWAETLHWQSYPAGTPDATPTYASVMSALLADPEMRAIILSDVLNEIGINYGTGPVGSDGDEEASVLLQDLAASDDVYITGGVYHDLGFLNFATATLPVGLAGTDISTASGSFTEAGAAGGYSLRVTGANERVTIGAAVIDITMPDGNVKLDLIGAGHIRSTHSLTIVSGASQAELIGLGHATLTAGQAAGAIQLYGNKGSNYLIGNSSANLLDGREGADWLIGGDGNDEYIVNGSDDTIFEAAGKGYDTVTARGSYTLRAGVSVELLRADTGVQYAVLIGNAQSQEIRGGNGHNELDGGGGGDVLIGGHQSNDLYTVRHAADVIVDNSTVGHDRLLAHVSYALAADNFIETLEAANPAATTDLNLTGNDIDQQITGNAGRNVLKGGGGADLLTGHLGKDTLYGGSGSDRFWLQATADSAVGEQRDVIADWSTEDRLWLSIPSGLIGSSDTQLQFVGLGSADRTVAHGQVKYYHHGGNTYVVGNTTADNQADFQIEILGTHTLTTQHMLGVKRPEINGTSGDDTINGFVADDIIYGGLGRDVMRGGSTGDTFLYKSVADSQVGTRRDVIADWGAGDLIDLKAIDAHISNYADQDFLFVADNHIGRDVEQGTIRTYQVGGNTYVIGNTNADNEADFQIEISGLHTLTHADFLGVTKASVIQGSQGPDTLYGTSRADSIMGLGGRDVLYGRGGADKFGYIYDADSQVGALRDTIADWEAIDAIDFSQFDTVQYNYGHDFFVFDGLGTADRSVAHQHVKYYHYAGNTYVVGSTGYDGQATLQIELVGIHTLTAANFLGLGGTPLRGTSASETINGTTGDDAIWGGLGTDLIYGRGGSDHFIYGSSAESAVGAGRDVIMDWSANDRFNLKGMDANSENYGLQAFSFVGLGSADRDVAQGAVKYYQYAGNTFVVGNGTADGSADFQIEIRGLHTLTESHFIL